MTTTVSSPIESHQVHSRRLIRHAEEWLALGDRFQAAESAWSAADICLKAIADRRGWVYGFHGDSFRVAHNLADEENNPQITLLFSAAHDLHRNIDIEVIPHDFLALQIGDVKEFLALLHAIEPPDEPNQEELQ